VLIIKPIPLPPNAKPCLSDFCNIQHVFPLDRSICFSYFSQEPCSVASCFTTFEWFFLTKPWLVPGYSAEKSTRHQPGGRPRKAARHVLRQSRTICNMQVLYDACLNETGIESLAVFKLTVADGRVFIQALDAAVPVFVNATALRQGERRELLEDDRIGMSGGQVTVTQKYWLKPGIPVTACGLVVLPPPSKRTQGGATEKQLAGRSQGVSIVIPSGTLTAIMGPAGCGKTLLLDVLTGTAVPAAGTVTVGQHRLVPGQNRALARQIGYVTQHETLVPELTVRQSLHFRLRLRFPDMSAEIRERRVAVITRSLAIESLLNRRIGSSDRIDGGLSGGERKRVGLAHELLMRPEILCLDEPTSGLSARDADLVVSQLRELADGGITVAVTIHQPTPKVFARFQHLILMAKGGQVLYSGPVAEAVRLVTQATGTPLAVSDGENPADYLVEQGADYPEEIFQHFQKDSAPMGVDDGKEASRSLPQTRPPDSKTCWRDRVRIFNTLVARSLRVFAQDATNLRLATLQIPAIALMVLLAFLMFETDAPEYKRLSRVLAEVTEVTAHYREAHQPVPIEMTIQQAIARTDGNPEGMTDLDARLRGAILFTLVASAFWIGLLGACREMVMDKHLLRHECRTCASVRSFLTAKLASLSLVALPQCALLALATAPFLLHLSSAGIAGLVGVLWLTALAASGIGLLTATLAPTARAALTAVPLIMVPQLLFAGLLRPEAAMAPGVILPRWLGYASLQRWGFELALATASRRVQSVSLIPGDSLRIVDTLDHLKLTNTSMLDCFFHDSSCWPPIVVLLGVTVGAVLISERHLRHKFHL
jgi:ABC-type multidrug transport system ATPase subunit